MHQPLYTIYLLLSSKLLSVPNNADLSMMVGYSIKLMNNIVMYVGVGTVEKANAINILARSSIATLHLVQASMSLPRFLQLVTW